jgi:hypothetical protein
MPGASNIEINADAKALGFACGQLEGTQLQRQWLAAGQWLEVVPNCLVQALAHGGSGCACLLGNPLVNGQCDVHRLEAMWRTQDVCAQTKCAKRWRRTPAKSRGERPARSNNVKSQSTISGAGSENRCSRQSDFRQAIAAMPGVAKRQ